jgi:hypothetical protein
MNKAAILKMHPLGANRHHKTGRLDAQLEQTLPE